ncbi:MAG: hypothetical protein K2I42_01775, partial [Anaeroplasmataceae bacterium]|nr:hypothetical protein [Anaeroplasmataceae bacterium]
EYKNANGKNVIVDLFDRKGVRKYCSIVFNFYDFKQEEWMECETKYGFYYISSGTYFGLLYKKGTNEIIERFELKSKKEKEYDFSIFIGTAAHFTKIEDKVL